MRTNLIRISGVLALLFLSACTKLSSDRVAVAIPETKLLKERKVGSQAVRPNGTLYHAVVNISGEGITGVMTGHWDRHNAVPGEIPSVAFDSVPHGSNRLIQALAIYRVGNVMEFHYTDKLAETGSDAIDIMTEQIAAGNMYSGRISGRYLDGTNSGPTGEVHVKFYPPNGRPPVVIEKSFIANGWFAFMALDGAVKLSYEVLGYGKLWGTDGVNLSDIQFDPGTQIVKASVPIHYRKSGENNSWEAEDAFATAIGWFGNSSYTTGKQVCRPTSAPTLDRLTVWPGGTLAVTPPAMPGVIITSGSVAMPTVSDLVANPNAVGGYRVKGGNPSGCSDPLNDMNLADLPNWMNGNGQDSVAYIFPPLKPQGSSGSMGNNRGPFLITMGSAGTSIQGEMLPGVGTDIFQTMKVYKRVTTDNWQWQNSGAPCEDFGRHNFAEIASVDLTGGSFNVNLGISQQEGSTGVSVMTCFKGPRNINNAGFVLNRYNFQSGGGGGGGGGPYLRLEMEMAWNPANFDSKLMTKDFCHPALFSHYVGMGTPSSVGSTAVSISGLPTTGNIRFYSNAGCSGGLEVAGATIGIGMQQSGTVYVKATQGTVNHQLTTVSSSGPSFDPATNLINVDLPKLQLSGPTRAMSQLCYSFNAMAQMANGFSFTQSGSLGMSLNLQGTTQLYTNPGDCATNTNSVPLQITGGNSQTSFYAKTTAGSTAAGTFGISAAGYSPHSYPVVISGSTGTAQGRYLRIVAADPPVYVSKCNPIRVSVVNDAEIEVPTDSQIPLKLGTSNLVGQFFEDSGCSSMNPNLAIMPGESGRLVYYVPFSAVAPSLTGIPSSLPISGGSGISVSAPGSGPYITFSPPAFGTKVVSSYEFGTVGGTTFTLSGPGGSSFGCSIHNGSTWVSCSLGEVSANTFTWPLSQAVIGSKYRITNSISGQMSEVEFDPKKIYGEDFQVINCGSTVPNASGTVAVQTLVTNTSPICLGSAVAVDCGATAGTLGVGMKIVGWSTKNNVFNSATPSTCFSMNGNNVTGTTTLLANINMMLNATTTGTVKGLSIMSLTGGSAAVVVANSAITTDAVSSGLTYGLWIQNNQPGVNLSVKDSALYLDTTQTGVNNSVIMTADNRAPLDIVGTAISATGTSGYVKTVISFNPGGITPGPILIDRSSIIGAKLKLLGNQFGTLGVLTIANSHVNVTLPTNNFIDLKGNLGGTPHMFVNNLFQYAGDQALFSLDGFGQTYNLKFTNNKFVHSTQGQIMSMTTSNGGTTPNIELNRNSFFSSSVTSSGNSRVIFSGGSDGFNLNTILPSASGGNLVCESDAGTHGWSGSPVTAPLGGSLTAFPSGVSSITPVANGCP